MVEMENPQNNFLLYKVEISAAFTYINVIFNVISKCTIVLKIVYKIVAILCSIDFSGKNRILRMYL